MDGTLWTKSLRPPFWHQEQIMLPIWIRKEKLEHYLLEYRQFREQRKKLRKEIGAGKMRVTDAKLIKHTLEYINATCKLEP